MIDIDGKNSKNTYPTYEYTNDHDEDRFLDLSEFVYELYEEISAANIASVSCFKGHFDQDFSFDYRLIRVGERYIVVCMIPETDLFAMPIVWCRDLEQVTKVIDREFNNFQSIEGTEFTIADNMVSIATDAPDETQAVMALADEVFRVNILDSDSSRLQEDESLIKPSDILAVLSRGAGLRPQSPQGFAVDQVDKVYIQDGAIWFGPIGGFEKYFSEDLGYILSCMGISWSSQRFVLTIEKGKSTPSIISTPEQFLDMYVESQKYLKNHRIEQEILELEEQQEVIHNKINKLRKRLESL